MNYNPWNNKFINIDFEYIDKDGNFILDFLIFNKDHTVNFNLFILMDDVSAA